jgi:hypothetical protein
LAALPDFPALRELMPMGIPAALRRYFNSYTAITDRTPELLSRTDTLERITFDRCPNLTNAGVATLARLPRLKEISVSGPGVTGEVVAAFPPRVRVNYTI